MASQGPSLYRLRMETCAVCLDEISSSNFKTICNHEFHVKCLLSWIQKNESCPSCRQVISKPEVIEAAVNDFFVAKPDLSSFTKQELFEFLEFLLDYEEYPFENGFEGLDVIGWNEDEKSSSFNNACAKGHLKAARYLINKYKFYISASSVQYFDWACSRGFHELVKVLIDAGADVTQVDPEGMNFLHKACYANSLETVTLLLSTRKFNLNASYNGDCAIHIATRKGNLEIVRLLVESGANFDLEGFSLETPLITALTLANAYIGEYLAEHVSIAKYLIERGASFDKESSDILNAFYFACSSGNIDIVKLLVELGIDFNSVNNFFSSTPFIAACENGNIEIVKFLIEHGVDINKEDYYMAPALSAACEHGHLEVVKLLIENGADLNICHGRSNSVLSAVARSNNVECFELLLQGGLDIKLETEQFPYSPDSEFIPFLEAIDYNNLNILGKFMESGMQVNEKNIQDGFHLATEEGFVDIVEYLLNYDFGYSESVMQSMLPLCFSCKLGRTEIALKYIQAGAPSNAPCKKGCYPIHHVCETGNISILESLIQNGADLNSGLETDQASPVYSATTHGHYEVLQKLLASGANPNIKHISGETALHKAISSKKWNFVQLLLESGADAKIENKKNLSSYELLLMMSNDNANLLKEAVDYLEFNGKLVETLFSACEKGNLKLLENILTFADKEILKTKNSNGQAAILIAVMKNQMNVFKKLVDNGVDIEEPDESGRTLLLLACEYGHVKLYNRLINLKADYNKTTNENKSALHLVAANGNIEIAKDLLSKGLDPNIEDFNGQSALEIAKWKNNKLIVDLISSNENEKKLAELESAPAMPSKSKKSFWNCFQ